MKYKENITKVINPNYLSMGQGPSRKTSNRLDALHLMIYLQEKYFITVLYTL
jgi:hypothetical protein